MSKNLGCKTAYRLVVHHHCYSTAAKVRGGRSVRAFVLGQPCICVQRPTQPMQLQNLIIGIICTFQIGQNCLQNVGGRANTIEDCIVFPVGLFHKFCIVKSLRPKVHEETVIFSLGSVRSP